MNLRKYLTPEVIAGGMAAVLAALAVAAREQNGQEEPRPTPNTDPVPWTPPAGELEGMGVSVRTLNHTKNLPGSDRFDGPALARWCEQNNVRFVELLACWVNADGTSKRYLPRDETKAVVADLKAAGVRVGLWGWPDPINDQLYIDRMSEALDIVGDGGWFKHDPEGPYHGAGFRTKINGKWVKVKRPLSMRRESAERLMAWSTATAPTDVTSYGSGPKSHPSFTWKEWANGARYGRPQWYDRDSDWSANKVASFAEQWRTLFPVVCPILSAVNSNTPDMMLDEANRFLPVADGPCFSYWDFYWLSISAKRTAAARVNGARYGGAQA